MHKTILSIFVEIIFFLILIGYNPDKAEAKHFLNVSNIGNKYPVTEKLSPVIKGNIIGFNETQKSNETIEKFLGKSVFFIQKLWDGRGGPKIVSALDGTVLAFNGKTIRQSKDGGMSWKTEIEIGDSSGAQIVVNEINGEILLVSSNGFTWRSSDHGQTWKSETTKILPNGFGHGSPEGVPIGLGAFQSGITLLFGEHKGRLLLPGRIFGPTNSNDNKWRPYHYNTSIYSDDNGKTWQTSAPFPVLGTGEAALAEISDGRILYSSREHMTMGNRFFAWSYDGGAIWLNPFRSDVLPDGVRGTSYGCMGGLVRLPIEGKDILLYSNLDSDAGKMPKEVGGSTSVGREKVTVWVSFDGGNTWPVKRLIFDGPSAYSSLGVGRANTPSEGKVFLLYEGGEKGMYSAVNVAVFNLSWLLDQRNIKEFVKQ